MRSVKMGRWRAILFLGCCLLAHSAKAGGPIIFNEEYIEGDCALSREDGCALPWLDNRAVYVVETGRLGVIENDIAKAKVATAFQQWTAVPTANLQVVNLEEVQDTLPPGALDPFLKDINIDDFTVDDCTVPGLGDFQIERIFCTMFNACVAQNLRNCPSPVVFDEDGTITETLFGSSGVVGFSGPVLLSTPGGPVAPFRILQAFTVLNGAFFDNDEGDDPTGTLFLDGLMTHEFGHFLGLGHSILNGDTALLNPAVSEVGTTGTGGGAATLAPVDALAAVSAAEAETMYPILLAGPGGVSPLNTLEQDDRVALSTLYPSGSLASTGTITGNVFFPDGTNAQGIVVIARKIDANNTESVLKEAASQLTGNTFAPRRCNGDVFLDADGDNMPDDADGDGVPDLIIPPFGSGLFGACTEPTQGQSSECAMQIRSTFLGGGRFSFQGQCGFFSAGLSDPRPLGEEAENHFVLKGLTPGKYLVQAVPVFLGGFSSPVLSNFGPTPNIISNDNVNFAFFPNPQVGEFYNGEKEAGNASDNPFAYTPVEVSAGGRVDNVNIVLNTSTSLADILSDPGFNFCELGDVNQDGTVDQGDILAVVQAEAAFEKNHSVDPHADLNKDQSITFLDIDIITDITTIPRPFSATTLSELKRGLAPFEAICTAAKNGGCRIQAPVETIQDDGTPAQEVCDIAEEIGCQVVECQ